MDGRWSPTGRARGRVYRLGRRRPAIAQLAAPLLKRVHLELGENSAVVVLDDADIEQAVRAASFGSFHYAGQVCMASGRHIVAAGLVDQNTTLLANRAEQLRIGNPADDDVACGPLIDDSARDRVDDIVHDSVAAGARLITGGTYDGLFYRPTVLADVPLTAPAYQEPLCTRPHGGFSVSRPDAAGN